jgi:hypothetical protein
MHDLTNRFLAEIQKGPVFHAVGISTNSRDFSPALFEETEGFLASIDTSYLPEGSPEKTKVLQIRYSALFLIQCFEHYLETLSRSESPFRGIFQYEEHLQALSNLKDDPDFGRVAKQLHSAYYNLHALVLRSQNKWEEAKNKLVEGIAGAEADALIVLEKNLKLLESSMLIESRRTLLVSYDKITRDLEKLKISLPTNDVLTPNASPVRLPGLA